LAESNYVTAQAQYLQVIGVPPPSRLAPAPPVGLSPRTLEGAIARGRTEHPLITIPMYKVRSHCYQVKIALLSGQDRRGRARAHLGRSRQRAEKVPQDLFITGLARPELISFRFDPNALVPVEPAHCKSLADE
jgi:hypothetical protein